MNLGMSLALGSALRSAAVPSYLPLALFANGEQGVWFDPSPTTCFTDTARTTAAAVGDTVAGMTDLSGNGNHATQATAAARPILRQTAGGLYYLEFDGVDDCLATGSVNFTGTNKMTVFAGVRKLSDAAAGDIVNLGTSSSDAGSFNLGSRLYASGDYGMVMRNGSANSVQNFTAYTAPITNTLTALFDQVGANIDQELALRVNGALSGKGAVSVFSAASSNFANAILHVGRRGSTTLPFNGHLFGLIVRGALTAGDDLTEAEGFMAAKTGVTL